MSATLDKTIDPNNDKKISHKLLLGKIIFALIEETGQPPGTAPQVLDSAKSPGIGMLHMACVMAIWY